MATTYKRALTTMVGALAAVFFVAAPARAADTHDPSGNNGTVKLDGMPFDDAPDNEPHPGCVFQLDFYGFDAGDLMADVTFEAVAPTAGGVLLTDTVRIGEDSHAGGGSERGLDASKTYDLTTALAGVEPQRNQGWHVRLTVHADGSQGSDVKHKVFWVDDCATTAAVAAGNDVASNDTSSSSAALNGTAPVAPAAPAASAVALPASVQGAELVASPSVAAGPSLPRAQVLAETLTRGSARATGASVLARTGIGLGLALLAFLFLAVGSLLVRLGAPGLVHVHVRS